MNDILHITATPEVDIYLTAIDDESGTARRERELSAEHRLIEHAFGPDTKLKHTEDGVPYVDGGTCISLSHSRSACALAVSARFIIGIDVEDYAREDQAERLLPRILHHAGEGHACPTPLHAWTAKEAWFKALCTRAHLEDRQTPTTLSDIDLDTTPPTIWHTIEGALIALAVCPREPRK